MINDNVNSETVNSNNVNTELVHNETYAKVLRIEWDDIRDTLVFRLNEIFKDAADIITRISKQSLIDNNLWWEVPNFLNKISIENEITKEKRIRDELVIPFQRIL